MTDYRDDPRFERDVYPPAEDSELLLAAARDLVPSGAVVVETGVGSGFVARGLQTDRDVTVLGTDVNPQACLTAAEQGIACARGSFLSCIATDGADVVLFNPPYLPDHPDVPDDWLDRAVAGGPTGAEAVTSWLEELPRVLRPDGFGLCNVSSLTDRDPIAARAEALGLETSVVDERRVPFETLQCLRVAPLTPVP